MKILITALLFLISGITYGEWTPPLVPNPAETLRQAEVDIKSKKYTDALAKHVWFHQYALRHTTELYSARFFTALKSWRKLGKLYPTALVKLKSIRDEEAVQVQEGLNGNEMFQGFAAINRELGEEKKTHDLFIWLDKNKPDLAHQVYPLTQRVLIQNKEYKLCSKYINAEEAYQRLAEHYRRDMNLSKDPKFGKELQRFGEKNFSNNTSTLIALLVLAERRTEAQTIADAAALEWNNRGFHKELKKALKGKVPKPWPK